MITAIIGFVCALIPGYAVCSFCTAEAQYRNKQPTISDPCIMFCLIYLFWKNFEYRSYFVSLMCVGYRSCFVSLICVGYRSCFVSLMCVGYRSCFVSLMCVGYRSCFVLLMCAGYRSMALLQRAKRAMGSPDWHVYLFSHHLWKLLWMYCPGHA